MGAIPIPPGNNIQETMRRLRAIDADFYGSVAVGGTITGGTIIGGDIYSDNWDGTKPPSLAAYDSGATLGFALDGTLGAAQFMGDVFVNGDIQMFNGGGAIEWYDTSDVLQASLGWDQSADFLTLDLPAAGFAIDGGPVSIAGDELTLKNSGGYVMQMLGQYVAGGFTGAFRWHSTGGASTTEKLTLDYDHNNVIGMPAELLRVEAVGVNSLPATQTLYMNGDVDADAVYTDSGTDSLPSHSFTSDPDTGMYQVSANILGVSAGGTRVMYFDYNSGAPQALLGNGTAASPAMSFISSPTTGFYRATADQISVAIAGTFRFRFLQSGNDSRFYMGGGTNDYISYNNTSNQFTVFVNGATELTLGNTGFIVPNVYNNASAASSLVYVDTDGNLHRASSALKYKTGVTTDIDLADIRLTPARFHVHGSEIPEYGLVADWLVEQDGLFGVYADGEVENYKDRAILAVLAAKVNRLEARLKELE